MKKIIIILLFSLIPSLPSPGQMVVTDPAHTAANILGHFSSLEEAIQSGVSLLNQLTVLKQTYEQLKAVKETFDKINQYIYNIQAITNAMQDLIDITQRTSDIYKQASRSNMFDLNELTSLMDYLTSAILLGTRNVNDIKDYVSSDRWRFTDKERVDAIEAAAKEAKRSKEELDAKMKQVMDDILKRQKIDYMNKNGLLGAMETYYANKEKEMTLGAELAYALTKMLGQSTEADTAQSAAKKTTELYDALKKLFFVLSAFIALIGAYRVYRKFNLEEDGLGKTAAIWFTSALTVFILGSIVELFLF